MFFRKSLILTVCFFVFVFLFFSQTIPSFAQTSDLVIQDYTLVSSVRISRTVYEYTYRADITNNGTINTSDVTATLASLVSSTVVIDGSLTFGDVSAGAKVTSNDTFKIRVNRSYPFSESNLVWTIYSNHFPVADAGLDQNVTVGNLATLDGSSSYDPDGNLITYYWTIVSAPLGSSAALNDPASVMPAFVPDVAGDYTFALTVNDGKVNSTPDNVVVIAVVQADTLLSGPQDEPANDHIPDIPFPAPDENDYLMTETMSISFKEVLLSFKDTTTVEEANALLAGINATVIGSLSSAELLLIKVPLNNFDEMSELLKTLNADPRVEDALMEMGGTSDNLPVHNVTPNLWDWQVPDYALNPSPPPANGNWGLELVRAPQMWNLDTYVQRKQSMNPVSAGVIDIGFTDSLSVPGPSTHPDFIRKDGTVILQIAPNSGGGTTGIHDHGTHVAGIIGATGNNGAGTEGINPWLKAIQARPMSFTLENHVLWGRQLVEILSLLASDATIRAINNSYGFSGTYREIDFLDNGANDGSFLPGVMNFGFWLNDLNHNGAVDLGELQMMWPTAGPMDLNGDGTYDTWSDVVNYYGSFYNNRVIRFIARKRGNFSLVASAGNAGPHYNAIDSSPIANASVRFGGNTTPNFISVESIDWNNNASDFSMINGTLSAPGSCVRSTEAPNAENFDDPALPCPWLDTVADSLYGLYGTQSGTSMAAPHVTGLITALWKLDPSLTAADMRTLLTAPDYTKPTNGGTQRRIDAFAAAMGIDIIHNNTVLQKALVDVDDGTLDGNQRTVRDGVGNILGDFFTNNQGDGWRGDEQISMKDFRAFRDAVTQALLEEGALSASDVSLDGSATHFKKDLNFDGCIGTDKVNPPHPADTVPVPPSGCSNTPEENVFPRYDFNGDGRVNPFALTEFKGTPKTDLQVLEDLWPDDLSLNEGWNKNELLALLPLLLGLNGSGDIEFRTSLLDNINTYDEIQITIEELNKPYRILTHTAPRLVWTVPRSIGDITVKAVGIKGTTSTNLCFNRTMPIEGPLKHGEDTVVTIKSCTSDFYVHSTFTIKGAAAVAGGDERIYYREDYYGNEETTTGGSVSKDAVECVSTTSGNVNGSVSIGSFSASATAVADTDPYAPTMDPNTYQVLCKGDNNNLLRGAFTNVMSQLYWSDTITIVDTSGTNQFGAPVNLQIVATLSGATTNISGDGDLDALARAGMTLDNLAGGDIGATFSQIDPSTGKVLQSFFAVNTTTPVQTATFSTFVGATIKIGGYFRVNARASTSGGCWDFSGCSYGHNVGIRNVTANVSGSVLFHVDPLTPGVSYTSASGQTYFSP